MLGEVILIQKAVRLALVLPVALVQRAHGAVHSLGVFPPAEIRVGDDQADRYRLGGRAVPFPRSGLRLWDRRSRAAIGRGDERAEDHEDLDPHLFSSSSSSFLPSLRSAGSRERGNVHSLFPISRFTFLRPLLLHTRIRDKSLLILLILVLLLVLFPRLLRFYFDSSSISSWTRRG